MKILCLSINSEDNLSGVPKWEYSLAFAYLQAYYTTSRHYSETEFINLIHYEGTDIEKIVIGINGYRPDILAVSCYIWNINKVLSMLGRIRENNEGIKIILGGPEFGPGSKGIFDAYPSIDIIAIGEGERTFKEVLDICYEGKQSDDLNNVKGIIFRNGVGDIVFTGKRENIEDLNEIPSPYLLGLVKLDNLRNRLVVIETQRGCIHDCAYCNYQKTNKKIRFFGLNRIKEELKLILSHQPKLLYLMDPTFNSNIKRAKHILEYISENRTNTILNAEMMPDLMDNEIIRLSKAAGMRTVEVGIQSLTPEAVKIMGRYRNEERLFNNIRSGIKEGLYLIPQIIFGLPGDNIDSFFETFDRVYELPAEELDILILLLLPQTKYRNESEKYGIRFNEKAPYEIIRSDSFSEEEIARLSIFRKIVLATQSMKLTINKINEKIKLNFHEIFLDFMEVGRNELKDFSWPIHSPSDKENATDTIERFHNYYINKIGDKVDGDLKKELYRQKRNAQFMIAARFMNLPKDVLV